MFTAFIYIIGFIWFLLTIGVLYLIWTGKSPALNKLLWTVAILIFPVMGSIGWMIFGYEGGSKAA